MQKTLIILGLLLGIGGAIFALLPSDSHALLLNGDSDNGMNEDNSMQKGEAAHHNHENYVTTGVLFMVIGFSFAFAGWKIF